MHVLKILRGFELDGPGRLTLSLLRSFEEGRLRVSVLALSEEGPLREAVEAEVARLGGTVAVIPTPWSQVRSTVSRAKALIKSRGITHLHAHLLRPDVVGRSLAKQAHLPYVYTEHGLHSWTDKGFFFKPFLRQWYLRSFPKQGRIVAVSPKVEGQLFAEGFPSRQVEMICNGVDLDFFKSGTLLDKRRARKHLRLSEDAGPVLSIVGGLTKNKRGELALRTLKSLRVAGGMEKATLLFAGSGPERKPLMKLAVKLGVQKHVRFLGNRPDPRPVYWASDILIHPSYQESFGLAVAEAAACGCPTLVRAGSGADAIAAPWPWGLAIEGDNPLDWSQGVQSLLKTSNIDNNASEMLADYVSSDLDIRGAAKAYSDLYSDLERVS